MRKAGELRVVRGGRDPRKAKAVMGAMLTMVKLDIAGLHEAYVGA